MHRLLAVCVLVLVSGYAEAEPVEVMNLIENLQAEMAEMRKSRMEDSRTIHHLQEQVRKFGLSSPVHKLPGSDTSNEDSGLESWKTELQSSTQPKTESESKTANQIRFLQRTVAAIRRELREVAAAVDGQVGARADRQEAATRADLLRADVTAIGHRLEAARADRERAAAALGQIRQEVGEIRQEADARHQRLLIQVDTLKDELKEHVLISKKKNFILGASNEVSGRSSRSHTAERHLRFRHNHWKEEVDNLQEAVNNLEYSQADLSKQLQVLVKHQTAQLVKLSTVEKNQSEQMESEKTITNQRLDILENLVNKTEEQNLNIQSRVNNLTSSGIQNLHGSTVELFNALERLESSYDRKTDDIRKEISKLDSKLSQTQSDLEELRERRMSSEELLRSDIGGLQSDVKSNHLRILLIQNSMGNRQQANLSRIESQIRSLTDDVDAEKLEIESLHKQVMQKADEKELSQWEKGQRKVRESILEFKANLPRMKRHQDKVDLTLNMLLSELPKDCSSHPSGPSLIRHPLRSAARVFCEDGWTVVQRRGEGGQTNFNTDWQHYKDGFGDPETDHWIGNELLHHLTTSGAYVLRVDMWDAEGVYKYAEYTTFRVLGEHDRYRLALDGYRGNASDAMNYHNGMAFSTPDKDNDSSEATHCADFYHGGWWYKNCQYVNINGRTGMTWYDIDGQEWSELTKVEMKIKPKVLVS